MTKDLTIHHGDAGEVLRTLPGASVQCCVTSPPYWGLRDYGVEGQIGLEGTPEAFIERLVGVFREVRRVLSEDGTLWVNMGDCYAGGGNGGGGSFAKDGIREAEAGAEKNVPGRKGDRGVRGGLKAKDLVGQPWMLAFALRADGWYLRRDIIWSKPNPMPESAKDRPVTSHEYVFLLSKSARYFYDAEAVRERVTGGAHGRGTGVNPKCSGWVDGAGRHEAIDHAKPGGSYKGSVPGRKDGPGQDRRSKRPRQNESFSGAVSEVLEGGMRQRRSVWTIPPAPFRGSHFATFPPDLVKPCVLAGTSAAGCCPRCGRQWVRVVEKGEADIEHQRACGGDEAGEYHGKATKDFAGARAQDASAVKARILAGMRERRTVEWVPGCGCGENPVPCTVLDPFGGSGTTGAVALELGRRAVLIELNPSYLALMKRRCSVTPGLGIH